MENDSRVMAREESVAVMSREYEEIESPRYGLKSESWPVDQKIVDIMNRRLKSEHNWSQCGKD